MDWLWVRINALWTSWGIQIMRYQILECRRTLARSKRVLIDDALFETLLDYVPAVQDEMAVPTFPEVDATRVAPMRLASARDAIRPPIPTPQSDARQPCHADALCPHPPAVNVRANPRAIVARSAAFASRC
jgi:hypothetical protein